jgi:uncharacterized repeat protein (TIGR03803 family)
MKRIVNPLGKLNWGKRACAVFVLCTAAAIALPGQTFTTLYSFDGTPGANPNAPLIQATDGNLYGITANTGKYCFFCGGTVFKITPSGTLTTLFNFRPNSAADGNSPFGGLIEASNGKFYATTWRGGTYGWGTAYEITRTGKVTPLYSFCSQLDCTDGLPPSPALVQGTDGNFYGTTWGGGPNTGDCYSGGFSGCGTVYTITRSGTLTILHSFDGNDGAQPIGGALVEAGGEFYGSTVDGGAYGYGTIFRITSGGTLTTLHSFNSTDGAGPSSTLVKSTDGNFSGTTSGGGANGEGTVFKITPRGGLTTLYSFCAQSGCADGSGPNSALRASDGNFYGTTSGGGANGQGTVFKITPSGALTTLHNFDSTDGSSAEGLVQDTNGTFYGTTYGGGAYNYGTVFSLSVGLGPFVKTRPHAGLVGQTIEILGTDLTGTTSVSFNGIAASFTVVSPSLITATIPTGATTGKVQVITPSGTLFSGGPFLVGP